jgi:hypothetical protein
MRKRIARAWRAFRAMTSPDEDDYLAWLLVRETERFLKAHADGVDELENFSNKRA